LDIESWCFGHEIGWQGTLGWKKWVANFADRIAMQGMALFEYNSFKRIFFE